MHLPPFSATKIEACKTSEEIDSSRSRRTQRLEEIAAYRILELAVYPWKGFKRATVTGACCLAILLDATASVSVVRWC